MKKIMKDSMLQWQIDNQRAGDKLDGDFKNNRIILKLIRNGHIITKKDFKLQP